LSPALAGLYNSWFAFKQAVLAGSVSPITAIVIVPGSWTLLILGTVVVVFVLLRWNGNRKDQILLKLAENASCEEGKRASS
jgi:hypothetical protein